jgi:anti-sigma B factor antagonist
MKIHVRDVQDGIKILDCTGKLTLGNGTLAFHQAVLDLFQEGQTKVILNFDQVSHLDGAALGELVGCWKRARAVGVEIKLLNPSGRLRQIMEMTQVSSLFGGSYSQEWEAIASFRESHDLEAAHNRSRLRHNPGEQVGPRNIQMSLRIIF